MDGWGLCRVGEGEAVGVRGGLDGEYCGWAGRLEGE